MFILKRLQNPFRINQYTEKQLIADLQKLVRELNARLEEIENKINSM